MFSVTHTCTTGADVILAWQCSEQSTLQFCPFSFWIIKKTQELILVSIKDMSVAALGSAQGHWALPSFCLADPSEPLWDRDHGAALLWQTCCCCWTPKNPGQVQKRAGGHLMRHESIRAGSCICTAWLSAASKSQWEVLLGSRKEQYDKHPVIYAQWKRSKHPGWRQLNVKMVYKCREKDISSVLLSVTKTKGTRYSFQRQLLRKWKKENASAQTHIFTNTSQNGLVSTLNIR